MWLLPQAILALCLARSGLCFTTTNCASSSQLKSFERMKKPRMEFRAGIPFSDRCEQGSMHRRHSQLKMALTPLSYKEARRVLPRLGNADQLASFWGDTPEEKNSKYLEVFGITFAGLFACWWATFLVGVSVTSLLGFFFIFYWLLGPNINAYEKNTKFQGDLAQNREDKGTHVALFSGRISDIREMRRSAYTSGNDILGITVTDELGKSLKMQVIDKYEYRQLMAGMRCEVLVLSTDPFFQSVEQISDMYVPSCDAWVGEYPYVDKARFKWLVSNLKYSEPTIQPNLDRQQTVNNTEKNTDEGEKVGVRSSKKEDFLNMSGESRPSKGTAAEAMQVPVDGSEDKN